MNIKISNSSDSNYIVRAERIIELYNQASRCPFDEALNLTKPESTRIIYSDHDSAGVLLDYHSDKGVWRIMFAAFDSNNRGKGLLRGCMNIAKDEGMDIALVEINSSDEAPVWRNLGYEYYGTMGICMVLSNRKLDFINYNAVMA